MDDAKAVHVEMLQQADGGRYRGSPSVAADIRVVIADDPGGQNAAAQHNQRVHALTRYAG